MVMMKMIVVVSTIAKVTLARNEEGDDEDDRAGGDIDWGDAGNK
jgi:hypothetical protein